MDQKYGHHREFARNSALHAPVQTSWIRIRFRTSPQGICTHTIAWEPPPSAIALVLSISIHQGPSKGKERWKLCVTFLCSLSDLEFDKTWKQTILNDCHQSTPSLSFRWSLQRDRIRDTYRWKMVSGVLSCTIHGKLLIHMVSYFGVTVFMQSLWPTVPQIGWVRTSCHT